MELDPLAQVEKQKYENSWLIPGAIVFAGLILAITVYEYRLHKNPAPIKGDVSLMRAVDSTDHILGSPSAPIKIIEYSDIDSSYSKTFQATLEQIMTEYAAGGKVAWVYRHLPLVDQHPYSAQHAEAAECAASIGGPTMFWRFINALNIQAPNSMQFNPKDYGAVVSELGIVHQSFTECMNTHKFQKAVASDFQNGLATGAGGSPFTILVVEGQKPISINGAVPYASMKKILDDAVRKLEK